jgi:pimeloyl-ACP methyl ester carboxylesterase
MKKYSAPVIGLVIICMLSFFIPVSWGAENGAVPQVGTIVTPAKVQTVRVGDIDIGYRIIGDGYPVVLITGYSATMDMWDPLVIKELSARYKVIVFDNRGIGRTTTSDRPFSVELFAEDTAGLMDALGIRKAHVLGWSMGTFIAEELALKYPDRVEKLVLYAGNCGWRGSDVARPRPEVSFALMDLSGTKEERAARLLGILFPKKWLDDHPDFVKGLPRPEVPVSPESIERQGKAIGAWAGVCGRLANLTQPTLVITGTEDVIIPPANSLLMASRIPGSWLIRIPGGHANMYQFPETFSKCLLTFLGAEKE